MEKYGVSGFSCIYENKLSCQADLEGFVLEGKAEVSFREGRLRLENMLDPADGQRANYVLWCPEEFPSDVLIEWEFQPIREPGLAMLFFAARGKEDRDLFDANLAPRTGEYVQYHHGDINAFHVSYFRRKEPDERAFHTCNLRKSYGFHLVSQGADPIPDADEVKRPYTMAVLKKGGVVKFFVDGLAVFTFEDDGETYGPLLKGGKIGFRQLAPMVGEYGNLKVYRL
ncbi:MAG: YesU family protein [Candidatus Gastranaerophilales bacterium]|nr:YesU family protein [Candidatus Gastranaerophilales bacterium]